LETLREHCHGSQNEFTVCLQGGGRVAKISRMILHLGESKDAIIPYGLDCGRCHKLGCLDKIRSLTNSYNPNKSRKIHEEEEEEKEKEEDEGNTGYQHENAAVFK